MDRPTQSPSSEQHQLLNRDYITGYLTNEAPWHQGHGASKGFLGAGMLYYSFAYALRARFAVCLGSGGAFVPRILRQAQRDMRLGRSWTFLVDANLPEAGWGSPKWLSEDSLFRKEFPEVKIILATTADALKDFFIPKRLRIDYLHIDADHSYEGCLADFDSYFPIMAESFVISIHDTELPTVARVVDELRKREGLELIDMPDLGRGVAFVRPRISSKAPKLYWAKKPVLPG